LNLFVVILNKGLTVKKLILIMLPIFLVSCSKSPDVTDLFCKEGGRDKEHLLRIDFVNSTMTDSDFTLSMDITENEMTSREIEEVGEKNLIQEIVIDRRTLVITTTSKLEIQDKYIETISEKKFQCELLLIPERQI
jgi:hypothetical protein